MPEQLVELTVANELLDSFKEIAHLIPGHIQGYRCGDNDTTIYRVALADAPPGAAAMTPTFSRSSDGETSLMAVEYHSADGNRLA